MLLVLWGIDFLLSVVSSSIPSPSLPDSSASSSFNSSSSVASLLLSPLSSKAASFSDTCVLSTCSRIVDLSGERNAHFRQAKDFDFKPISHWTWCSFNFSISSELNGQLGYRHCAVDFCSICFFQAPIILFVTLPVEGSVNNFTWYKIRLMIKHYWNFILPEY